MKIKQKCTKQLNYGIIDLFIFMDYTIEESLKDIFFIILFRVIFLGVEKGISIFLY